MEWGDTSIAVVILARKDDVLASYRKKQDDEMYNLKVGNVSKSGRVLILKPTCGVAAALAFGFDNLVERKATADIVAAPV